MTLITLGKYFETLSKGRTSEAIKKLMHLSAKEATVLRDGKEVKLPVDKVVLGDHIVVKPGEKIAVDGQVISGSSAIDESMLTGESLPIEKSAGKPVFAGSINGQGSLIYEAEKIGKDTLLPKSSNWLRMPNKPRHRLPRLPIRCQRSLFPLSWLSPLFQVSSGILSWDKPLLLP